MAEETTTSAQDNPSDQAIELLNAQGAQAAINWIERQDDPKQIYDLYHATTQSLCFKQKNIPAMVTLSRSGIDYFIKRADASTNDEDQAARFRGWAKALSYNLGANTWPGWGDEGIELTDADLVTGMEAAKLNLKLAQELDRPAEPMSNAHWLVGAHELARQNSQAATIQFRLAHKFALNAENQELINLQTGYLQLALLQGDLENDELRRQSESAIATLQNLMTDDAKFFADQLVVARDLLVNSSMSQQSQD